MAGIVDLKKQMAAVGALTVGEYSAELKEVHQRGERLDVRTLHRWIGREQYLEEFDRMWDRQRQAHPQFLTDDLREEVREGCIFFSKS
jgi:hypothetical protein